MPGSQHKDKPVYRPLQGYAFDPSFAYILDRRLTNQVLYKVKWEDKLLPGPIGEYIEVVDYDPPHDTLYTGIDLNDPYILATHGLPPSEEDPRFHQQQVYAVAMSVIDRFEAALGRKIIFSRLIEKEGEDGKVTYGHEFVARLRIYPHAFFDANAYYSPDKLALLFGYFKASASWDGRNVPGTTIFTCLSPDIVAHECTHALLDSMLPYLNRATNPDVLGFHEAFADIIALLQRFTYTGVVREQINNSRGDLYSPDNLLGDLAFQFGQALPGNRRALRSYLVDKDSNGNTIIKKPDPALYRDADEAHDRGAVLVATVFDAFARLYNYRVADLIRIASDGTGILTPGAIDPDLAGRLSTEACHIADKLSLICIRALDYCPPVDITFSDYLRSLITADVEHNPEDDDGLRYALMESFRAWGIVPEGVSSYSLRSLIWSTVDEYRVGKQHKLLDNLKTALRNVLNRPNISACIDRILREAPTDGKSARESAYDDTRSLSAAIHEMLNLKMTNTYPGIERLLGMDFGSIPYSFITDGGAKLNFSTQARNKFQIHRCRPFIRTKANGRDMTRQLIISFIQKVYVDVSDSTYADYMPTDTSRFAFNGGCTLIVDLSTYDIRYAVIKSVSSSARLKKQLENLKNNQSASATAALLMQEDEPFCAIHNH